MIFSSLRKVNKSNKESLNVHALFKNIILNINITSWFYTAKMIKDIGYHINMHHRCLYTGIWLLYMVYMVEVHSIGLEAAVK